MCARSVLDTRSYFHTVLVGQMAHNVGASDTPGSPRGDSPLTEGERSAAANLLLLCPDCHRTIDAKDLRDLYTEEFLRKVKADHEERVAKATNFEVMRRTLVISTRAQVRGSGVHPTPREIAESMVSSNLQAHVRDGEVVQVVLDIQDSEDDSWVWNRARARMDSALERLAREVGQGSVDHVSVFAIAPIPILAYLGSRLDDKLTVEVFERRRATTTQVWCWDDTTPEVKFEFTASAPDLLATDVLVVVSVSGTVDEERIPTDVSGSARIDLRPVGVMPRLGLVDSRHTRDALQAAWLGVLGTMEASWPRAQRVHVLGAVPASLAVFIGQSRIRQVHPAFIVYQRHSAGAYAPTPAIDG